MTEREYGKLVKQMAPKSPMWRDCLNAFLIGGLICALGQLIMNGYIALGLDKEAAGTAMSMTLVALAALLTVSFWESLGYLLPWKGTFHRISQPGSWLCSAS